MACLGRSISPQLQFQGCRDKMVFSADISFSSDRLWRPATILSMSRWTSGGRSGYCLFRWWSTRWACGFHGAGRVPFRSPDGLSNIIQIASLHCCSCCHILPFPWLLWSFVTSHFCIKVALHYLLVKCVLALFFTVVQDWWCWCASPSFLSSSACCWSGSISGISPFLSSGWRRLPRILVVVSTTTEHAASPVLVLYLHDNVYLLSLIPRMCRL